MIFIISFNTNIKDVVCYVYKFQRPVPLDLIAMEDALIENTATNEPKQKNIFTVPSLEAEIIVSSEVHICLCNGKLFIF